MRIAALSSEGVAMVDAESAGAVFASMGAVAELVWEAASSDTVRVGHDLDVAGPSIRGSQVVSTM